MSLLLMYNILHNILPRVTSISVSNFTWKFSVVHVPLVSN